MSYLTISDAQTYFDTAFHTESWDRADTALRNKALARATIIIDRLPYLGHKLTSDQENEFPRHYQTAVPKAILDACCEIALALLNGIDIEKEVNSFRETAHNQASVRTTYDSNVLPEHILAGVPCITAYRLLRPFMVDPHEIRLH